LEIRDEVNGLSGGNLLIATDDENYILNGVGPGRYDSRRLGRAVVQVENCRDITSGTKKCDPTSGTIYHRGSDHVAFRI